MNKIVSVTVIEQWNCQRRTKGCQRHLLGQGGESRYLNFNLSFSPGLVTRCAISPSLDEITAAGASGELKVDSEGILLCDGQIGARLRGGCWGLSEGIGLPLCQGKAVRDDGAGEEEGEKGAGQTSVSSSGL